MLKLSSFISEVIFSNFLNDFKFVSFLFHSKD
jgi:hypothetical protein